MVDQRSKQYRICYCWSSAIKFSFQSYFSFPADISSLDCTFMSYNKHFIAKGNIASNTGSLVTPIPFHNSHPLRSRCGEDFRLYRNSLLEIFLCPWGDGWSTPCHGGWRHLKHVYKKATSSCLGRSKVICQRLWNYCLCTQEVWNKILW